MKVLVAGFLAVIFAAMLLLVFGQKQLATWVGYTGPLVVLVGAMVYERSKRPN